MFAILPEFKENILLSYKANMSHYPSKQAEVDDFLQNQDETYAFCMRFLYGHMNVNDIVSFSPAHIGSYVSASLQAYDRFSYCKKIPQALFFSYVLQPRVNSEWLDGSRAVIQEEIAPYVQGKDLEHAALNVNYWCYSHATYTPTDNRTLGPIAVMRRTLGRCGEESVLAVSALRSVGIPARQCYVPRWSHCDDNHAWVEVWVDGAWHYMGACEPEPVLDKGWFTAAASRAMLVHTKCWSDLGGEPDAAYTTPLYSLVNRTAAYADTKLLTIRLSENGAPLPDTAVEFQIVNFSELYPIFRKCTDANGMVTFITGLGDLCIYLCCKGRIWMKKVDVRILNSLEIDLADAKLPEELPEVITMDLVPPAEKSDTVPDTDDAVHAAKMQACEDERRRYISTFWKTDDISVFDSMKRGAAGNWKEIDRFLKNPCYTAEQKTQVLSTLREKDFVDITCDVLCDALDSVASPTGNYDEKILVNYVLAPRVANEMLLPCRKAIRDLFPNGFENPGKILAWMQENLEVVSDHGIKEYYPSAYGCLKYRKLPAYSFDMVFVSLCRAFGFPARLNQTTGRGQWFYDGNWQNILQEPWVTLTLENRSGKVLHYQEHFTLSRWNGQSFSTLSLEGMKLEESCSLQIPAGFYRLITTTRQIDGTASARILHFSTCDSKILVQVPENQTASRMKCVPLLPSLPDGPVKDVLLQSSGESQILVFADPGGEPTEHLLQEFLECEESFNEQNCRICIFLRRKEEVQNATLQNVMHRLTRVQTLVCTDSAAQALLQKSMEIHDKRLPFTLLTDTTGHGVFASANYNIHTAQTLLLILKLLGSQDSR